MNVRVRQLLSLTALTVLTQAHFLRAVEPRPGELALTMEQVVVFKDGYALFVKRAVGTTDADGQLWTDHVPDAVVLGSFWAVPKEGRLISMTAGEEEVETTESKDALCLRTLDLLQVNLGRGCTVRLNDETELAGTIHQVLAEEMEQPVPATTTTRLRPSVLSSRSAVPPNGQAGGVTTTPTLVGEMFVLRTAKGDVTLPVSQVLRLTVKDMKTSRARHEKTVETKKLLRFQFEEAEKERELLLFYFGPGVRWIPTYRIELAAEENGEKEARIALQAEIINEAEDLLDVPFHLVVGVPNFRFKDTVSPLILERTLRNALQQAAPQVMGQLANNGFSNAIMTQVASAAPWQTQPAENTGALQLPQELAADRAHDLFVYTSAALTVKEGQRAAIPLFTATAPYKDVYTWDLHVRRHDIDTAPSSGSGVSPLVLSKNEVWHQVILTNNTDVPWTTGPALIMQDLQPLAQELLTYTPPGASLQLPVTVAVDVRGTLAEEETGRQLNALQWDRNAYALIKKRATLALTSFKSLPVACEVICRTGGKATSASDEGGIRIAPYSAADWQQYRGSTAVNNHSDVTWTFTVEPGKATTRTIDYEYYVRH